MKKNALMLFLGLSVIIATLSCNKNNKKSTYGYNPPSWLIGNWADSMAVTIGMYSGHGYKVSSNDIVQMPGGQSFKAINELNGKNAQQSLNGNTYHITLSSNVSSGEFYFVRVNDSKIRVYSANPTLPSSVFLTMVKY
jgi:hypothetical protein